MNSGCVVGTDIWVLDGTTKSVEDLEVGEDVLIYSLHEGLTEHERISKISSSIKEEYLTINGDVTVATNQFFLRNTTGSSVSEIKHWTSAENLNVGDEIECLDGNDPFHKDTSSSKVETIQNYSGSINVYHIEILGREEGYFTEKYLLRETIV
jgi:hypothetical protein